jgi:hypothetical protein
MFRPVAFDPYRARRKGPRVPRWLVLLAAGVFAGAGGLLFAQHRYLPPRLSAEESARLKSSYEQAAAERERLQQALGDATRRLEAAETDRKRLAQQADSQREAADRLRSEMSALIAALPPDPRGGLVQVRAARFSAEGGKLLYDVTLSRERAGAQPLSAVMQLAVAGTARRGPQTRVDLEPVALSMDSFQSLKGHAVLPDGFAAREATIRVLDQPHGKLLGMRVIAVK